ncbi:metallophosphoesterase family protein [Notoacmeibacter ruber]|uniref:metallophosphoesterase family protein n=1 Tax=Notoacmeibacter ruber TaxID=2670375 RepID=UPI0013146154|nr:DNA repair exonuclease [Notoacmeibacter ruber]
MSRFCFVHAADLHLGTRFHGLAMRDEEMARHFAAATRRALERLVDKTIERQASFLLIAGDIYDGEWRDAAAGLHFAAQMARLDRAGIKVVTLRGNHDAASVVRGRITLPDNVVELATARPQTIEMDELRVAVHGQGFADRSCAENLATRYPSPKAGFFNIGLLHTSLDGRPGHGSYAPCTPVDLEARGYDYWALGHIHEFEVVRRSDPMIVYPGNLQGRSIREKGPKGAVLITVEDGRIVGEPERLLVDAGQFAEVQLSIDGIEEMHDLWLALSELCAHEPAAVEGALHAMRIVLTGQGPLHGPLVAMGNTERVAEAQAAADRKRGDVRIEKVKLRTRPSARPAADNEDMASLDDHLSAVAEDPAVKERLRAALEQIGARMTAGVGQFSEQDVEALLLEGLATAQQRVDRGD